MHPGPDRAQRDPSNEIDYVRARNAAKRDHTLDLQKLIDFTKNWRFVLFAGALVLFHLCNASLLPLVSENLAHSKVANSSLFMGGLIVVPQVVVAILAPWIGYWSELWGRKPLLLTGFIIEVARSLLFALVSDPLLMMVVQLLDGVTGATVTVLTILVITDLTPGTGRFNLAQGVLGTMRGIAAAIGTASVGFIVQQFGDLTGCAWASTRRSPDLGVPAGNEAREVPRLSYLARIVGGQTPRSAGSSDRVA